MEHRPWHGNKEQGKRNWPDQPPKEKGIRWKHDEFARHIYDTVYNTQRWKKTRAAYLLRNPLCVMCENIGRVKEAKVLDHVIPIREGGASWDEKNLQGLCSKHHKIKTNQEKAKYAKP